MQNRISLVGLLFLFSTFAFAQDFTYQTFKDTRVINTQSVETLPKRKLDIRIGHRFGDLTGGWQTLYGLENAQDVSIGAGYGVTNSLTVELYRTKAAGPLSRLVNLSAKYKILHQKEDGSMPVTMTFLGVTSVSTMSKNDDFPDLLNSFPKFSHRMVYSAQLLIARKFSNAFSLQLIPAYTHRNLVAFGDENGILSLGLATRVQLTKVLGIIADFTYPISDIRNSDNGYYPPMGIGLEIDTGGHVFQVNFTNARGIAETDYIPNTRSNWFDGEFRLGFTISRTFNL